MFKQYLEVWMALTLLMESYLNVLPRTHTLQKPHKFEVSGSKFLSSQEGKLNSLSYRYNAQQKNSQYFLITSLVPLTNLFIFIWKCKFDFAMLIFGFQMAGRLCKGIFRYLKIYIQIQTQALQQYNPKLERGSGRAYASRCISQELWERHSSEARGRGGCKLLFSYP